MKNKIFKAPKPIVAMVHLKCGPHLNQIIDAAMQDVERLEHNGVDGLLFENWGDEYRNRFSYPEDRECISKAMEEVSKSTNLPYGVNILPLHYEAAFDIALRTNAKFVQIDTFVDKVRTDYDNKFILYANPQEIISYRKELYLDDALALFTNIQTKHYTTIPSNKKLETSAIQAIQNGADVLVVTGKSTGKKTPKEKIIKIKRSSGNVPVFIGSGFDLSNAEELLPYADGVIVGSSLKYDGITENPVDEERVKRLVEVVHKINKNL